MLSERMEGLNEELQKEEFPPVEQYRFQYTREELDELYRLQRNAYLRKAGFFVFLCVVMLLYSSRLDGSDLSLGWFFGIFFLGAVIYIKTILNHRKAWKSAAERIARSCYEYKFYADHIEVRIFRELEAFSRVACEWKDVERVVSVGNWLLLQFGGQIYLIRKSDLKENSLMDRFIKDNPSKTADGMPPQWKTVSKLLFVASFLSLPVGLALVKIATFNRMFPENMWLFYLLTPFPIASAVFGLVMKAKGYRYKRNLIAGVIFTVLLCIYGSFTFIFAAL